MPALLIPAELTAGRSGNVKWLAVSISVGVRVGGVAIAGVAAPPNPSWLTRPPLPAQLEVVKGAGSAAALTAHRTRMTNCWH